MRRVTWPLHVSVPPNALRRGLIAGSTWGIATGLIVTAAGAWECGGVCISDAAVTMALSIAAGLGTIGPLAAFGRARDAKLRLVQRGCASS